MEYCWNKVQITYHENTTSSCTKGQSTRISNRKSSQTVVFKLPLLYLGVKCIDVLSASGVSEECYLYFRFTREGNSGREPKRQIV